MGYRVARKPRRLNQKSGPRRFLTFGIVKIFYNFKALKTGEGRNLEGIFRVGLIHL